MLSAAFRAWDFSKEVRLGAAGKCSSVRQLMNSPMGNHSR